MEGRRQVKGQKKLQAETLVGRGFERGDGRNLQKRFGRKIFTPIFAPPLERNG